MGKPAARVTDSVAHPLPPILTGGPGSSNVLIGGLPAWRGLPAESAAMILAAKKVGDAAIQAAEAATAAAVGPAVPIAYAVEQATKGVVLGVMSSLISSAAASAAASANAQGAIGAVVDTHTCSVPLPIPPHGPGVVVDGSNTVLINGLPACFQDNTVAEATGPMNKITMGYPMVEIGTGPAVSVSVNASALAAEMESQIQVASAEAEKKAIEEQKAEEEKNKE